MVKYSFYILMPVMMLMMIFTLPPAWKNSRRERIIIAIYSITGIVLFTAMISEGLITSDPAVRQVINYGALIFFVVTSSEIFVFVLRYLVTYAAIRLKAWSAVKFLLNNSVFMVSIVLCSVFFLLFGSFHFNDMRLIIRDVNLTDGSDAHPSQCTIGLISDLHLGAGADDKLVDKMCRQLENQHPDLICITGDLVDMTTLESDLEYFADKVNELDPKYGIYYVEGNHEKDSDLDCPEVLEPYGINCLYDEAVTLDNGVTIVGRRDDMKSSVSDILRESSVPEDSAVVVMSHRPVGLKEMSDQNYLVLCGHTHGYQIPMYGLISPFVTDLPYGYHEFGRLKAITTAGTAAWGYRIKWPSYNENWIIRLIY